MLIITLRTDKPEAEIGLYDDEKQLSYVSWQAHRQLSETIHIKIKQQMESANKGWNDITGIVFYSGPGSFTGLRIGAAVANALRGSLGAALVNQSGEDWLTQGIISLLNGQDDVATPVYGAEARTTQQKR